MYHRSVKSLSCIGIVSSHPKEVKYPESDQIWSLPGTFLVVFKANTSTSVSFSVCLSSIYGANTVTIQEEPNANRIKVVSKYHTHQQPS